MSHRVAPLLAWSLWGLTLALWVGALWLRTAADVGGAVERFISAGTFMTLATGAALVASRRPESPFGWIASIYSVIVGIDGVVIGYAVLASSAGAAWVGTWIGIVGGALLTLALFVVPDGRLPSPRWRPALWLLAAFTLAASLGSALAPGPLGLVPGSTNPFGLAGTGPELRTVSSAARNGLLAVWALSVISLFARFRTARGEQRQQLKWVAAGAATWVLASILIRIARPEWFPTVGLAYLIGLNVFVGAVAVAILRFRLYELDLVVNTSLVYATLAVFVTATYIAIVVGAGVVVGTAGEPNLALSIAATAIVAVAFQPVRERAQRLANRLVFGHRASPYEVLADYSRRLADALSIDDVPTRTAEAAARGVGAVRGRVRVFGPEGVDRLIAWPPGEEPAEYDRTVPVLHQGVLVGEIAVAKEGAHLRPHDVRLLADLAAAAGPALHNVRLALELRAQASELRASRQRIVTAQDAERRRLERDIHDGAQQHLVALAITARLARESVRSHSDDTELLLDEVSDLATQAIAILRDLARGIFPPVLADRGLAAALEGHIAAACPTARLEVDGVTADARYAPEVEAAVYFCCLEALQNCTKHAPGAAITVSLTYAEAGWLQFAVSDRGPGFDLTRPSTGSGHQNLADRLAALDGTLDLRSTPGDGTTVAGRLPAEVLNGAQPHGATGTEAGLMHHSAHR